MRWRRRTATPERPTLDEGWQGQLKFDVLTPAGLSMGVLEIELEEETVEVRFCDNTLGVFERDVLRDWMFSPGTPLAGDSCALSMQQRGLAIALGCASPFPIPTHVSRRFRAAVCGA